MAPLPIGLTLGAIELGVLLSSVLWGCTCVQTYMYATGTQRDGFGLRLLVGTVFTFETLHMVLVWIYFYDMTVIHYGEDFAKIASSPWTFNVALGLHAWTSAFVQAFFSYRIWRVSKRLWLAAPAWFVAFARVAVTMTCVAVLSEGKKGYAQFTEKEDWLVKTALSLSMSVDIWNTTALSYYLWSVKGSVFNRTSALMSIIIRITMETGLVIVLVALGELIVWTVNPQSGMWIGALMVYARMYSNSLLVSLNSREKASTRRKSISQNLSGGIVLTRTCDVEMSAIGFAEGTSVVSKPDSNDDTLVDVTPRSETPFDGYQA